MKTTITEEAAKDLMIKNNKDPEDGMEYLNGLEIKLYYIRDVMSFIER